MHTHPGISSISAMYRYALCILFLLVASLAAEAQSYDGQEDDISTEYDEVAATGYLDGVGSFDMTVIITSRQRLFINIEELFRILELKCELSVSGDTLHGFLADKDEPWNIDFTQKIIQGKRTITHGRPYLIKNTGFLFIDAAVCKDVFNLEITFNYRALACNIKPGFELPLVKKIRLQKIHNALSNKPGFLKPADTVLQRSYHVMRLGSADWAATFTQMSGGTGTQRISAGLGGELLFGEANLYLNYSSLQKFDSRQMNFLWRYNDNNNKLVRQAEAGRINNRLTSYLNAPIIGASLSNASTAIRKASGYYDIDEVAGPNWVIELYINNTLADFTKADAAGHFRFQVPITYGFTTVKLKYYGPAGEERILEKNYNTSFTLMPAGEMEYNLSAGMLQDSLHNRFARGEVTYGLSRKVTMSSGLEYFSALQHSPAMPFAKLTYQPMSKLLLNAEYTHDVRILGSANYYFSRNAFAEISASTFAAGQMAIPFSPEKQWSAKLSLPLNYRMAYGFASLEYSRQIFQSYTSTLYTINASAYYHNLSLNLANTLTVSEIKGRRSLVGRSAINTGIRLKQSINVRPSLIFDLKEKNIAQTGIDIEKRMRHGLISLGYQQQLITRNYVISASLRLDLKYLRTQAATVVNKNAVTTSQSAQGSLFFGGGQSKVIASSYTALHKGGIIILPFLDINGNGLQDKNEPLVKVHNIKVMGGTALQQAKDSMIRIPNLTAFNTYRIEFADRDLDNIAWRFSQHQYDVLVDPNQFKQVKVPVVVMGELSGYVYLNTNKQLRGLGRIKVKILDEAEQVVAETMSESDGFVQYLGLKPGKYKAVLDEGQLKRLTLAGERKTFAFEIKEDLQGDIISSLELWLKRPE